MSTANSAPRPAMPRTERPGRTTPDFTFDPTVRKQGPHIETADERVERLMASLRVAEGSASTWQCFTTAAAFLLGASGVIAAVVHLFRL